MFKAASYIGSKLCRPGDIVVNTLWAWMAALGATKYGGIVSPAYGVYRPHSTNSFNPLYLTTCCAPEPMLPRYWALDRHSCLAPASLSKPVSRHRLAPATSC